MSRKILAGLAACAIAAPYGAGAQQATEDWQSIDALTATVANALGRTATPIDRRIKLARCPEQASITAIDARTLAVRCDPLGWRLRVPMTGPVDAVPAAAGYARPAQSAPVIRRGDNVRFWRKADAEPLGLLKVSYGWKAATSVAHPLAPFGTGIDA